MKPLLVTSYVDPDLDGTACAMAYSELLNKAGRSATVGLLGQPHDEALYLFERFSLTLPTLLTSTDDFDSIVLVDASDLHGLVGKLQPEKVVEIIDHRQVNEADKFPHAKVQIELVGAAATLVTERFQKNHVTPSRESALLLWCAIVSNTLNFKGGVTTERDRVAVEWLGAFARPPQGFWRDLFVAKSNLSGPKLLQRLDHDFAWFTFDNKHVGIAQLEIIGVADFLAQRKDEIVACLQAKKFEMSLDYIFLNGVDLSAECNFFCAVDLPTQSLLATVFNVQFVDAVAQYKPMLLRKQIVPLLKEELVKK